jgi:hypothetical protein
MREQLIYLKYLYFNSLLRLIYKKLFRKSLITTNYAGKRVMSLEQGNEFIKQKIAKGDPFMAGRFGCTELNVVEKSIGIKLGIQRKIKPAALENLCILSGFFPQSIDEALQFGSLIVKSVPYADMMGIWRIVMEDYVLRTYGSRCQLALPGSLEPYYHAKPWSEALEGRNVLVIHPFSKTILSQYKNRTEIFRDRTVLPEFNLKTLKAVQTIAGEKCRFASWFEALDSMVTDSLSMDFDVAIIGCGAYGFPLAARIKEAGKQAIHMGGATQILFGIKGARWDNDVASKFYNNHWVRPLAEETPRNNSLVENGCYW